MSNGDVNPDVKATKAKFSTGSSDVDAAELSRQVNAPHILLAQATELPPPGGYQGSYPYWQGPAAAPRQRDAGVMQTINLDLVGGIDSERYQLMVNERVKRVILVKDGHTIQKPLKPEGTAIEIDGTTYIVNPSDGNRPVSIDKQTPTGTERTYANGEKVRFNPNGDYIDRSRDVAAANGVVVTPHYATNGKTNSYEIKNKDGQVIETGMRTDGGRILVKRIGGDGELHEVPALSNRSDFALRANGRIDYLDRDGYGVPDQDGKSFKRANRIISQLSTETNGKQHQDDVNQIQSIRFGNGSQIDYTYVSDNPRAIQNGPTNDLNSYTVYDGSGRIVEFAHQVPWDMNPTEAQPVWYGFRVPQGLPKDLVKDLKDLLSPASPDERDKNVEVLNNNPSLVQFITRGDKMRGVNLDQVTGKQVNIYADGTKRVLSGDGIETTTTRPDARMREPVSTNSDGNGRTLRRSPDSDDRRDIKDPATGITLYDRSTVTRTLSDGRQVVELFHLRSEKQQQFMKVGYAADGTPNEIMFLRPPKAPGERPPSTSMNLDRAQKDMWNAETKEGIPTSVPMKVRVADSPIQFEGVDVNGGIQRGTLPAGTLVVIINPGTDDSLTRAFSPTGVEVQESKAGTKVFAPLTQQRETQPEPRDPSFRRQEVVPGWPLQPGPQRHPGGTSDPYLLDNPQRQWRFQHGPTGLPGGRAKM